MSTVPKTVKIYLESAGGKFTPIATVHRAKLIHFSDLAATQLADNGPRNPHLPHQAVTICYPHNVDETIFPKIFSWIENNDLANPTQITLASWNLINFDEIVRTYATAYSLRLKREVRGDDLRNALYEYLHQGALTAGEFAYIRQWIGFDGGLVKTAVHEVAYRWAKGGVWVPPEIKEIERYCWDVGMGEELIRVKEGILKSMAERDRREGRGKEIWRVGGKDGQRGKGGKGKE